MKNYYQILGLSSDAEKDEVKKAYRRLAMKYHPDVNPGKEAREKFIEVLEAYEYIMGIRKSNASIKQFTQEEWEILTNLYQKAAKEKAKARYRERILKFRKEKEKEQAREYTFAFYILICLIVLFLSFRAAYNWYVDMMIESELEQGIVEVVGIGQKRIIYQFKVEEEVYVEEMYAPNVGLSMLNDVGLPVKIGDKFEIEYKGDDPSFHRINFNKMSDKTFNRYFKIASKKLQSKLGKELDGNDLKIKSDCLTLLIYQENGAEGLASIIFSDSFFLDNFDNNSLKWYFKWRSESFNEMLNDCRLEGEPEQFF